MSESKIRVYTTKNCAFCHAELEWLDKLGVPYEEIDAEKLNFSSVPVTKIGEKEITGFNRPAIKRALKKQGLYEKKR